MHHQGVKRRESVIGHALKRYQDILISLNSPFNALKGYHSWNLNSLLVKITYHRSPFGRRSFSEGDPSPHHPITLSLYHSMPHAPCSLPHAPCPMLHAPHLIIIASISFSLTSWLNAGIISVFIISYRVSSASMRCSISAFTAIA